MTVLQIVVEWSVSFIEVFLYILIIQTLAQNRFQRARQAACDVLISAVVAVGIILLNLVNISFSWPTILYAIITYALSAAILYRGRFAEFIFASIGYIAGLLCIDFGCVSFMRFIGMESTITEVLSGFNIKRIFFVMAVKGIEIVLVVSLCKLFKKMDRPLKMSKGYSVTILCLVLGSLGSLYWIAQIESIIGIELDAFQTILAVCGVLAFCVGYLAFRVWEIHREKEYTAQQNRILENNYQTAEASYESNAKLYHDMWNHFSLLQGYLADGKVAEARAYLDKISGDRSIYNIERWTGIDAIDYILSQKIDMVKQQNIAVSVHAEYPKDCKIDPVDLCTILTNLLDNAIEACGKQPVGAARDIEVVIRRIHQFIIIRISNSSVTAPIIQNGRLMTTKGNRLRHGWGIQSVKSATMKYQGTMEYDYSDSVFTVSVMLFYE